MTTQAQEPSYEFSVGDRFRKAREMGTALDQKKFAELIGVSRDTIRKVEHATVIEEVRKPIRAAYSMSTGYAREWLETGTMPEQPTGQGSTAAPIG